MTIMKRGAALAMLVTVLIFTSSGVAHAQRFRGRFFDPFWGPYPYGAYPIVVGPSADVRVQVEPKQTEVYVDGFYAGTAGNFDGVFKRLHTTPGGHAITLHLEGYKTVTQNIYVRPDSTFKIQDTMDRLAAGEVSTPVPMPSRRARPAAPPAAGTPDRS